MGGFKATFINEVEKLYKKKKALVGVIISLLIIIIGQLGATGLSNGFGLRATGSMEFPIMVLSIVANSVIPLFTALVTIDSFSGEFAQNTMKIALTRPITRLKFFTAKLAAISCFILANLLFVMIFSIIAGVIFNANSFTIHNFIRVILAYMVTLFPMIILALLIIIFTNILRSGIGAFFLSILVFIVLKTVGIVFSQYSSILFTNMLSWFNLWLMNELPLLKIFRQFLLMLGYGIILFTSGYYLFDKKEF
jgi:ABC-2 type transport system permease protein